VGGWLSAPTRWPPPGRRAAKRRPRPCYGVECFSVPADSRASFLRSSLGSVHRLANILYYLAVYWGVPGVPGALRDGESGD